LLLLNFIDAITFFRQYQRKEEADQSTGEVLIKTHPEDIELAFALLKNSLFRRADELSTTARGFYNWLKKYLSQAKTKQFTALDVRKVKRIHPRTLNRYLQELCLFHYIQVAGGNKYREGYQYKITNMGDEGGLNLGIENALRHTLETIKTEHEKQHCGTASVPRQERQNETSVADNTIPQTEPKAKRTWTKTSEKEERTFKLLLELEAQQPQRTYLPEDFTVVTERSLTTEAKYLKVLWEQGKLTREWRNGQFYYALATESSRTVGQTTLSDTQTADIKEKNSKTTTKIKNNDDANT
jgi:DNA-binding HxlR family transcriptional regulator